MKYIGLFSLVGLAWCSSPAHVSYDRFKTIRISTEVEADRVANIICGLQLLTLKESPSFIDVLVPPERLDIFRADAAGLDLMIMHENLGAAIADEASFIAGKLHDLNNAHFGE